MKTKIFSILASAAMLTGVASCDSYEPTLNGTKEGKLNTASIAVEVSNAEKIINDAAGTLKSARSRAVVDLSGYIVTVVDADGQPVKKWTYSQMPELPTFTEGSYTVKVASGEEPVTAAWDAPWFRGEQSFTIKADEVTDVDVVKCTLANIRVTVKFTDDLVKASAGDLKVVVRSEGAQSLTYTPSETRSGYFAAVDGLVTLSVAFSGTVNGTEEKFTKAVTDVDAGQHRIITFGLRNNPNQPPVPSGQIDPTEGINVSTDVTEEDLTVDVPFEEEVIDPSGRPGQEGEDPNKPVGPDDPQPPVGDDSVVFTSSLDDVNGLDYVYDLDDFIAQGYKADLSIDVPAGIAQVMVKIDSDVLTPDALTDLELKEEFDLVNPGNPTLEEKIHVLGFPTGNDVKDKTNVKFDITGFMTPLSFLGAGHSDFVITVTDNNGHSKTVAFKFNKK